MKRRLFHFLENEKGMTAVEFSFGLIPLLLLLFGVFETGRLYYVRSNLQNAAFAGERYAMINTSATNSQISSQVSQKITAVSPAAVTITVQNQTIGGKPYKQITLAYNFSSAAASLVNYNNIPLSVQASVPVIP
jgi:Flp pilus assembly protein TadG